MNLDRGALAECCEEASALGCVQICNYNCPGQLVIGGEKAAVEKAAELAKAAGARRCMPLKVSGPFHTKLMHPAGDALAKRFASEHFGEMETPVLFNCLGDEKADSDRHPRSAGKAGAEQRLHGGYHSPSGRAGRGRHREDRPGQGPERLREKDAGRRRPLHRCRDGRGAGSFPHQLEGGDRHERRKADPCRRRHRREPGHRPGCLCRAGKAGLQCGGQLLPR